MPYKARPESDVYLPGNLPIGILPRFADSSVATWSHGGNAVKTAVKPHPVRPPRLAQYVSQSLPGFEAYSDRPIIDRLREATRPVMSQVAPGLFAPYRATGKHVPENCLCFWSDKGDGTYFLMPHNQRLVRLDAELAELLGFRGQYQTIRRLGEAGFIEVIQIAPHTYFINLDSWFNHLRRCAEDPEFWEKSKKNLKAYRSVI